MSEKTQGNARKTQESMERRYQEISSSHHKHDKRHLAYRQHCRTHGVHFEEKEDMIEKINTPTGTIRKQNLQKIRKRLAKNIFH